MFPTENPTEDLLRATRERFNVALAEQDVETIHSLLAPSYHIITGRSEQSFGAEQEAQRWTKRFGADPTTIYRRTPREFDINEDWGIAQEFGNWRGSYSFHGEPVHVSGVYAAKWQRTTSGRWVVQAEMFTTLTCTAPEGGCIPPDAIDL